MANRGIGAVAWAADEPCFGLLRGAGPVFSKTASRSTNHSAPLLETKNCSIPMRWTHAAAGMRDCLTPAGNGSGTNCLQAKCLDAPQKPPENERGGKGSPGGWGEITLPDRRNPSDFGFASGGEDLGHTCTWRYSPKRLVLSAIAFGDLGLCIRFFGFWLSYLWSLSLDWVFLFTRLWRFLFFFLPIGGLCVTLSAM